TTARHPLRRAISWFFHSWHRDFLWSAPAPQDPARVDELVDGFHERLPTTLGVCDRWFDEELAAVTGHDVFSRPFDGDGGWELRRLDGCDLAIVRTEDLDGAFAPMCAALLGTTVKLERVNEASGKPYRDLRRAFLARFELTEVERRAVAATRHARHFYSAEELEAGMDLSPR
ncbi:MAG: putative capsular polysaccharide synthesis family protein, partial [Iamia sp.]